MSMKKTIRKIVKLGLALSLSLGLITQPAFAAVSDPNEKPYMSYYNITNPYADVDWDTYGQYKANLHTHTSLSNDVTGGANTYVSSMIEKYYAEGYDIVSINDHQNISRNWDDYASTHRPLTTERYTEILTGAERNGRGMVDVPLSNEQNNMMRGQHVLSYFTNWNANAPVTTLNGLFGALATYDQVFTGINNAGGIGFVAHPGREVTGIITAYGNNPERLSNILAAIFLKYPDAAYGLEIFGVGDGETRSDRVLWDRMLMQTAPYGKNVFGISNDDAHSTSEVGRGGSKTMFVMAENTVENVEAAMRSGSFYASAAMTLASQFRISNGVIVSGTNGEPAFNYVNSGVPTPVISNINIDGNVISVEGKYYHTIEWIADGAVIATGNSIDLMEYKDVINSYIRFQLKGDGGISWANPMLLELIELDFVKAAVKSFNANLQNGNNGNLKFVVTVTLSDGSTYEVEHTEKVKGGEKGSKTFDYGDYKVSVTWNDNNKVTKCEVDGGAAPIVPGQSGNSQGSSKGNQNQQ